MFLRELVGHSAPVTKIAINSATGTVLTATTTDVRVWSINGDLLAAASTASYGLSAVVRRQRSVARLCPSCDVVCLLIAVLHQTAAISTRCEMWQDGVVAVTGHANGTIALWGLSYPSDIERARRAKADSAGARAAAVRISSDQVQREQSADCTTTDACPVVVAKVVPSCQLFIMKLLLDHRAGVTALTLGADQRQLISGDADGNCIRWVDDSISTIIL